MARVDQGVIRAFLPDGRRSVRCELSIDDLLLHKALCKDTQIVQCFLCGSALGDSLIDRIAGSAS